MGAFLVLQTFEPQTEPRFDRVAILERGPSKVVSDTAARSEPQILIELETGQTRRLPGSFYAIHPELETACIRRTSGRFSGVEQATLVPPENCP